jgi:hypothetical protein
MIDLIVCTITDWPPGHACMGWDHGMYEMGRMEPFIIVYLVAARLVHMSVLWSSAGGDVKLISLVRSQLRGHHYR